MGFDYMQDRPREGSEEKGPLTLFVGYMLMGSGDSKDRSPSVWDEKWALEKKCGKLEEQLRETRAELERVGKLKRMEEETTFVGGRL